MVYGYIGSTHPLNSSGNSNKGYMFKVITLIDSEDEKGQKCKMWASISAFSANFGPEVRSEQSIYNFHIGDILDPVGGWAST